MARNLKMRLAAMEVMVTRDVDGDFAQLTRHLEATLTPEEGNLWLDVALRRWRHDTTPLSSEEKRIDQKFTADPETHALIEKLDRYEAVFNRPERKKA